MTGSTLASAQTSPGQADRQVAPPSTLAPAAESPSAQSTAVAPQSAPAAASPSTDQYFSPQPPAAASPANQALADQFSAAGAAASTPTREAASTSRLAQAPEMFGDSMTLAGVTISVEQIGEGSDFAVETFDAQFPVGSFGLKVSDNNSPLPRDRIYYRFSYYENLIDVPVAVSGEFTNQRFSRQISLPVHTVGVEKTFCDGYCSIEVRAPFSDRIVENNRYVTDNMSFFPEAGIATAGEGNVSTIAKCIIGSNDDLLWSGGIGVEAPTGRDTLLYFEYAEVRYQNEAVYLYPYLAALWTPNANSFHQAFFGVNVPVSKDELAIYQPFGLVSGELSRCDVEQPVLISVDVSSGYWIVRNRPWWITDVAVIGEVHYTGSLGSGEFHGEEIDWASNVFVSTPAGGSLDMVNLTGGLHLQFGPQMSLRVSGVVPVADDPFTNEFTAQWTYWY